MTIKVIKPSTYTVKVVKPSTVTVVRKVTTIKVYANSPAQWIPRFVPFFFTATEGQEDFELDTYPLKIVSLAFNGILQSEANDDFSVTGKVITIDEPANAGDTISGVYVEQ